MLKSCIHTSQLQDHSYLNQQNVAQSITVPSLSQTSSCLLWWGVNSSPALSRKNSQQTIHTSLFQYRAKHQNRWRGTGWLQSSSRYWCHFLSQSMPAKNQIYFMCLWQRGIWLTRMGSTLGGVVAIAKYWWMELVAKAKFTVVKIISNGQHTSQCALLNPPVAFMENGSIGWEPILCDSLCVLIMIANILMELLLHMNFVHVDELSVYFALGSWHESISPQVVPMDFLVLLFPEYSIPSLSEKGNDACFHIKLCWVRSSWALCDKSVVADADNTPPYSHEWLVPPDLILIQNESPHGWMVCIWLQHNIACPYQLQGFLQSQCLEFAPNLATSSVKWNQNISHQMENHDLHQLFNQREAVSSLYKLTWLGHQCFCRKSPPTGL